MYELKERDVWGLPTDQDIHRLCAALTDSLIDQANEIFGGMDIEYMREVATEVNAIFRDEYILARQRNPDSKEPLYAF